MRCLNVGESARTSVPITAGMLGMLACESLKDLSQGHRVSLQSASAPHSDLRRAIACYPGSTVFSPTMIGYYNGLLMPSSAWLREWEVRMLESKRPGIEEAAEKMTRQLIETPKGRGLQLPCSSRRAMYNAAWEEFWEESWMFLPPADVESIKNSWRYQGCAGAQGGDRVSISTIPASLGLQSGYVYHPQRVESIVLSAIREYSEGNRPLTDADLHHLWNAILYITSGRRVQVALPKFAKLIVQTGYIDKEGWPNRLRALLKQHVTQCRELMSTVDKVRWWRHPGLARKRRWLRDEITAEIIREVDILQLHPSLYNGNRGDRTFSDYFTQAVKSYVSAKQVEGNSYGESAPDGYYNAHQVLESPYAKVAAAPKRSSGLNPLRALRALWTEVAADFKAPKGYSSLRKMKWSRRDRTPEPNTPSGIDSLRETQSPWPEAAPASWDDVAPAPEHSGGLGWLQEVQSPWPEVAPAPSSEVATGPELSSGLGWCRDIQSPLLEGGPAAQIEVIAEPKYPDGYGWSPKMQVPWPEVAVELRTVSGLRSRRKMVSPMHEVAAEPKLPGRFNSLRAVKLAGSKVAAEQKSSRAYGSLRDLQSPVNEALIRELKQLKPIRA